MAKPCNPPTHSWDISAVMAAEIDETVAVTCTCREIRLKAIRTLEGWQVQAGELAWDPNDTSIEPIAPDGPPCPRCHQPMFKVYVDDDEDFVWGHDCEPD